VSLDNGCFSAFPLLRESKKLNRMIVFSPAPPLKLRKLRLFKGSHGHGSATTNISHSPYFVTYLHANRK
jgi:hypothetical protein